MKLQKPLAKVQKKVDINKQSTENNTNTCTFEKKAVLLYHLVMCPGTPRLVGAENTVL